MDLFDTLPNEIMLPILVQHLDPVWKVVCNSVCKRWHILVKSSPRVARPGSGVRFTHKVAQGGYLKVLQWAYTQGCPLSELTCAHAAQGGHLEVLQWARSQLCPWNEATCAYAARGGHLEVLQWARSQGCNWDAHTSHFAARGGHLKVLQWARSQGCPWNELTCAYAAEGGHLEVLQWARGEAARGMHAHVPRRCKEAIRRCCNGPESLAALRFKLPANNK